MTKRDKDLETAFIPDIEIEAGWTVSEINSLEDCEDAFSYLMAACAEIEHQLEQYQLGVVISPDQTWKARANRALKYKKAALQLVGWKRGEIGERGRREFQNSRDRLLLDYIRSATTPKQFLAWVVASGVDSVTKKDFAE